MVALTDLAQPGLGGAAVARQLEAALGAEHDVVEHRHVLDQHEVLVHHADAQADRLLAVADLLDLAVEQEIAAVGAIVTVQDAHQGRFAGAVFPHQAVDRALGDGEVDVRVRLHMSKVLGDVAKFYSWLHRIDFN
jgi:hypothetical protein